MGRMRLGFTPFNAELDYEAAFPLAAELGLDLEVAYDLHEAFPLPGARELRATGRPWAWASPSTSPSWS